MRDTDFRQLSTPRLAWVAGRHRVVFHPHAGSDRPRQQRKTAQHTMNHDWERYRAMQFPFNELTAA